MFAAYFLCYDIYLYMKFNQKILKNGLRIITIPMSHNPTVTVLVLTATGSHYETKEINGISHFLEHLCFKGTERRPGATIISQELDGLGSQYNAFTGEEWTGYYAKAESKHFKKLLDIVSDITLNSTFPAEEIDKERGVIIGEIDMYEDSPQDVVDDVLTDVMYGDQPAGWTIAGEKKNIRSLKRDDFVSYKKNHYVAEATVVVIAGKIKNEDAVGEVEKLFCAISEDKKKGKVLVKESQKAPNVRVKHRPTNQAHLKIGFRAYKRGDARQLALHMLAGVLSGGMSSRLFVRVRDELGLGYYVGARNQPFADHGIFTLFSGVENTRIDEAIKAILAEASRLKKEKVPEKELMKVKDFFSGTILLGVETSDNLAFYYGERAISSRPLETPIERIEKLRAVTAEDIQNAAMDVFQDKNLNLAIIGPFKDEKHFLPLLSV